MLADDASEVSSLALFPNEVADPSEDVSESDSEDPSLSSLLLRFKCCSTDLRRARFFLN